MKIRNFGVDFGATADFLTPYRVESIGKIWIFGVESAINVKSSMRGFQITSRRLHLTAVSEDMNDKVILWVMMMMMMPR